MDAGDDIKPLINTIDVQRGWKDLEIAFKSDERRTVRVQAPAWEDVAALHLESGSDIARVERGLLALALPAHLGGEAADAGPALRWLDWLDVESRNEIARVVREFTYGFRAEKKRALALQEISKMLSLRNGTPPSSVSGSDSPTPSAGAVPSSSPSPDNSAESNVTTA